MSTSSQPQLTAEEIKKTREKFARFRILVIGRANAGKTTILRRVCNTTGEPIIFNPSGEKIESSVLDPSLTRGEHDIENQMIFEGNPGFIFHDSRGFEAGGDRELKLVQQFIKQHSKAKNVNEQLHAIWYCIPTSDDRPITAAERKFFNECGTGLVPVIVLWTKTDFLDLAKIKQLIREGNSRSDAMQQAPGKAWADFEENIYRRFAEFKYPPKAYVVFREMHKPGGNCNELIKKTADALSSEELQQLFLSTQQNNLDLCVEYAIQTMMKTGSDGFKNNDKSWAHFMVMGLKYFPHYAILQPTTLLMQANDWIYHNIHWDFSDKLSMALRNQHKKRKNNWDWYKDRLLPNEELHENLHNNLDLDENLHWDGEWGDRFLVETHDMDSISKIMLFVHSGLSTKFNFKEVAYCAIVAAIVGHLSFFLHKESPENKHSLEQAAQIYQQSTCDASVKQAVENLFKGYDMTPIKHGISNLFKHSHVDDALVKGAIQIALDNLLSLSEIEPMLYSFM